MQVHFPLILALLFIGSQALAHSEISFIENKGQWHENVRFKADIPAGAMFLEKDGFTYTFFDSKALVPKEGSKSPHGTLPAVLDYHAFNMQLIGSRRAAIHSKLEYPTAYNYYLGKDPAKWASGASAFGEIEYSGIYPGIDMKIYSEFKSVKYDFIVQPGGNPNKIRMNYTGLEGLYLDRGNLHFQTSVNKFVEYAPYAYQDVNGVREVVPCYFELRENTVRFAFPQGYNTSEELVIDPKIVFASYSGSVADNWGSTATYDDEGNLYGGGISFGVGYPVSVGAYQINYSGGSALSIGHDGFDVSVSKFSSDGSRMIYSTYLGGSSNEFAQGLIVDNAGNLVVYGTTSSPNFPITTGTFQTFHRGGRDTIIKEYLNYPFGVDMFLTKLNDDGSSLIASTLVGGTGNDGLNLHEPLAYNYGDNFRGDIAIDNDGNCYVTSATTSTDFPVTPGAFQTSHQGRQDACVFKISSDFTTMLYSTYLGGSGNEAGYSLEVDDQGQVFLCGGTNSQNFPVSFGAYNTAPLGGIDAFVSKLSADGSALSASTLLGTSRYDQAYILDMDDEGFVYVFGQSAGNYPISSDVYFNANSHQFIDKLRNDLTGSEWSTVFGSGNGRINISPTAMLVSDCKHIYISGYGGEINDQGFGFGSSTNNLPITSDAFQTTTDGNDFYFAVFERDASDLRYGSFFGGGQAADHVDGGTSRFDKEGNIYQAICAGCGGLSDMPGTSGAYSPSNGSDFCNLGVVKFDLAEMSASIESETPTVCFPSPFQFVNQSHGGMSYLWDFGDGNTSTEFEPEHTYADTGTYDVSLLLIDSLTCQKIDIDVQEVKVVLPPQVVIEAPPEICLGETIILSASANHGSYNWSATASGTETLDARPGMVAIDSLDLNVSQNLNLDTNRITVSPITPTTYSVVAIDEYGCSSRASDAQVHIKINPLPHDKVDAGDDRLISWLNGSVQLQATVDKVKEFHWTMDSTLSCGDCLDPIANPSTSTDYYLHVTDYKGCKSVDTVSVFVEGSFYVPNAFTPDNDGRNDIFNVYGKELEFVNLWIYNRWGELVHESQGKENGWNGLHYRTNEPVQIDTYVWRVLAVEYSGKEHAAEGHVTVVR